MQPLVTIVAISFNQEKYVIDTLDSIRKQTYPFIQLIIADDGSKDETKNLIAKWIKENLPGTIFLNHPVNLGITKNLNSALPYIKGEFYQFIGCEDIMMPDKIGKQVALLNTNKEYDIVYSDMLCMDENGILEKTSFYKTNELKHPSGFIYEPLLEKCFITTPTVLMNSKVLFELGGDNEALEVNDYDFWIRASKKFNFLYHDDITMKYRVVANSVSRREGIFPYRNKFTMFYMNYDRRAPYKKIIDRRLLGSVRALYYLKYKKAALFGIKAFLKSGQIRFLYYSFKAIPNIFNGKKTDV